MKFQDSAFAIILQDELVLLVKARPKENWQLPGGRLEPGESSADALIREVLEETGFDAEPRHARITGFGPERSSVSGGAAQPESRMRTARPGSCFMA